MTHVEPAKAQNIFQQKDTKDFSNITDSRFAIYKALLAMPRLNMDIFLSKSL